MLANDNPEVRKAIEECDYDNARDPIITFKDTDIKWYPSNSSVSAHTFIYTNAHELEMGSYRFVSLGEDGAEECETENLHDGHDLYDYIGARHELVTSF